MQDIERLIAIADDLDTQIEMCRSAAAKAPNWTEANIWSMAAVSLMREQNLVRDNIKELLSHQGEE